MSEKIVKTLRFDLQLIKRAEMAAKAENRSLNNWIETLIMRELRFDPFRQSRSENDVHIVEDTRIPHRAASR